MISVLFLLVFSKSCDTFNVFHYNVILLLMRFDIPKQSIKLLIILLFMHLILIPFLSHLKFNPYLDRNSLV